ncbi:hypothetical protein [Dactylosporangium sp. NPDC051541]|uniref:hypothetical protein n=1 Tax=Dactylosporangium sp. NPDC051541 TaxID=3363977 RepID=UPI0037ADD771
MRRALPMPAPVDATRTPAVAGVAGVRAVVSKTRVRAVVGVAKVREVTQDLTLGGILRGVS